jgi:hypothetical protein
VSMMCAHLRVHTANYKHDCTASSHRATTLVWISRLDDPQLLHESSGSALTFFRCKMLHLTVTDPIPIVVLKLSCTLSSLIAPSVIKIHCHSSSICDVIVQQQIVAELQQPHGSNGLN